MRRVGAIALVVTLVGACSGITAPPMPTPAPLAFRHPFTVDGYNVELLSLTKIEYLSNSIRSNPGEQLYILAVRIENHTGSEQGVGSGFRIQDDAGLIVDGNFISPVEPQLDATLADGGRTSGTLGFSLTLPHGPQAVLVRPGRTEVSVPVPAVAARESARPTMTPSAPMSPTPAPKPTPTPKPTLRPASFKFGTFRYEANACWDSSFIDWEGHEVGGIVVRFSLTVKNRGQVKSQPFTITTQTTDWFETNPLSNPDNWELDLAGLPDARTVAIKGPSIGPGKTVTLKWSTYFLTPFDPHYTVTVTGPGIATTPEWSVWTNTQICY